MRIRIDILTVASVVTTVIWPKIVEKGVKFLLFKQLIASTRVSLRVVFGTNIFDGNAPPHFFLFYFISPHGMGHVARREIFFLFSCLEIITGVSANADPHTKK